MIKPILIIFYLIFLLPIGVILFRKIPFLRDVGIGVMLLFTASYFAIHLWPIPEYTGTSRGFAFTMVDFLAPMIVLSLIGLKGFNFTFFPKGVWIYFLYFFLSCLSWVNVIFPVQYGWEVWKMVTMYIFMISIYNYMVYKRDLWPVFYILIGLTFVVFMVGVYQKYFGGIYQIYSTFPHQNSLSMYMTVLGTLFLGVLFNEKCNIGQFVLLLLGFSCASLLVFFTYSRGGIVCYSMGVFVVLVISLCLTFTLRKLTLTFLLVLMSIVPLMHMAPRIIERFERAPEASKLTRIHLASAAVSMANERFFGVGLNHFAYYSSSEFDYYPEGAPQQQKEPEFEGGVIYGGIVETIYLLVAAETGWVTFGILVIWLLYYFILNILNLWAYRGMEGFGLAVGIMGALSSIYTQSSLEWVLKQFNNFYQLMFLFAIIAVMYYFRKENSLSQKGHDER